MSVGDLETGASERQVVAASPGLEISRRALLKLTGWASLSLGLAACGTTPSPTVTPSPPQTPTPTASTPACADISGLARMPDVEGVRYRALVPDTLDLHERAELVLGTMTRCTDATVHRGPYDNMLLNRTPPVMKGVTQLDGKYFEATALLRRLTGNQANREVDQAWRSHFFEVYAELPGWGVDPGRLLAWMGDNYAAEGDPCWLAVTADAVGRLDDQTLTIFDYTFMVGDKGQMPTGWDATWGGWTMQGLAELCRTTGDEQTFELAGEVARYLAGPARLFDDQGRFLARHPSEMGPALHFHHNGNAMEGLASYALVAGDREIAALARASYEWARSTGSPLVGFFPEYIEDWPDDRGFIDCETCAVADMIQTAMNLSQAGEGDYWDDVDRYVRNQFIEMQILDAAAITRRAASYPRVEVAADEDAERVAERLVGSFATWASANDWFTMDTAGTTFCCIGNGARTLYKVWDKMLTFEQGTLTIHLLLNRASAWADVASHVPYTGRVDISVKVGCEIELRIPEWVAPGEMAASVNGISRPVTTKGRYVRIGRVEPGDAVSVTFPISERRVHETIGGTAYALVVKGNDVVDISPGGRWYPFYKRERYRENEAGWVERDRFVPAT